MASRRPSTLGIVPEGTVSLAMGEPFGGTPEVVVDAAITSLRRGRTRYAPLTGDPSLRARVARHLGDGVTEAGVVLTHGASAGLAAVVLALVDQGDRVVLPEPTYSLYADHVAMAGGNVDWVSTLPEGGLDLDRLAELVPGSKLVMLCNPSNPTGRILSESDLRGLADLAAAHGAWVLVDEAYRDIVFDAGTFTSALSLSATHPNVVCCGTFSKSYAMTGWRLGWVACGEELAADVNLIHRSINGALNTFVQDAAHVALELPADHLATLVAGFRERRDLVVDALEGLEGVTLARPQGAFYAFPRIEGVTDSRAFTMRLAQRGVLVRAGWEYGPSGEGHVRISFATDLDALRLGLDRLRDYLAT
ncbi:aspartate aminotransferase [Tamaricihabitans halophyticus]|uniref:Aspartate aminotransferase n=1 Tax=Tamaricihabitans halophyticus TaxID=1262583 RepID=A0A4R2PVC0_9PSEU|nr:pyridoxal phosphate-dependent aminotransferase [Tamaricihabitans halophyticus]TCP39174.1 aspartate aminotransferase [Tamaricihabitans halophyticus]